jgi:hypothetical protein
MQVANISRKYPIPKSGRRGRGPNNSKRLAVIRQDEHLLPDPTRYPQLEHRDLLLASKDYMRAFCGAIRGSTTDNPRRFLPR